MRFGSSSIILLVSVVALLSFTLGGFVSLRRAVDQDARIDELRAEMALIARDGRGVAGTSGLVLDGASRSPDATSQARSRRSPSKNVSRSFATATATCVER